MNAKYASHCLICGWMVEGNEHEFVTKNMEDHLKTHVETPNPFPDDNLEELKNALIESGATEFSVNDDGYLSEIRFQLRGRMFIISTTDWSSYEGSSGSKLVITSEA